jgi:hypothetical protein
MELLGQKMSMFCKLLPRLRYGEGVASRHAVRWWRGAKTWDEILGKS